MTYDVIGITGATGFIGAHLLRFAVEKGHRPVIFRQPGASTEAVADLEGKYDAVEGDLMDRGALDDFTRRCEVIYHLAGFNRYWAADPATFRRVNVEGARNVAEACLRAGTRKLVHASSCITLGASADGRPRHENSEYNLSALRFAYGETKKAGESLIKRYVSERGLPAVIVNPTSAVGEADFGPTPIGKPIADIARGLWPVYVAGGACFIDVHDAVRGFWLAMERAKPGSQYLLVGENLSNREFMTRVAEAAGVGKPRFRVPGPVLAVAGRAGEWMANHWTRRDPPLTRAMSGLVGKFLYFDGSRAEREIGFRAGPCGPAIRRCVEWFKQREQPWESTSSPAPADSLASTSRID